MNSAKNYLVFKNFSVVKVATIVGCNHFSLTNKKVIVNTKWKNMKNKFGVKFFFQAFFFSLLFVSLILMGNMIKPLGAYRPVKKVYWT